MTVGRLQLMSMELSRTWFEKCWEYESLRNYWKMLLTKYDKLYFSNLQTILQVLEGTVVVNWVVVMFDGRESSVLVRVAEYGFESWHAMIWFLLGTRAVSFALRYY